MLWEYRGERHPQKAARGVLHSHKTRAICSEDFGEQLMAGKATYTGVCRCMDCFRQCVQESELWAKEEAGIREERERIYLSHVCCCNLRPNQSNLREKRFILAYNSRGGQGATSLYQ